MEEFYINVELGRVMTRIQVDEVPPERWDMPNTPQFIIDFHNGRGFVTLTIQLDQGYWYDSNTRKTEDDFYLNQADPGDEAYDPYYQSPLSEATLQEIGRAIARHMIVLLTTYMGLFVPAFPTPTLN